LAGSGEQQGRHIEAMCICGLEIDDEVESWTGALRDLIEKQQWRAALPIVEGH
jgi:hypothetical protein